MTKTINLALIKQAVLAAEANRRQATSHTKTRGNVAGGGRKPWRQKGTGNARAGSRRSPIWVGGGITFGPQKERNYKQNLSKKMAKAAFAEMIGYLEAQKLLMVTTSLKLKEAKTKEAIGLLKRLNVDGTKVLLVTGSIEPELVLACRNLPGVTVTTADNLSLLDLASTPQTVFDAESAKRHGIKADAPKAQATTTKTTKKA